MLQRQAPHQSKTYRATNNTLDSKQNILLELESIIERFNNRIMELSLKMKVNDNKINKEKIEQMNKLKTQRTKLNFMKKELIRIQDNTWMAVKENVQELFETSEKLLVGSQC